MVPSADTAQGKEYLLLHISCTTSGRGYDLSNYFYGFISLVKIMETTFSVVRIPLQTVTKGFRLRYKDYISQTDLFFDVFLTVHHSTELFHLSTLMHNSYIH